MSSHRRLVAERDATRVEHLAHPLGFGAQRIGPAVHFEIDLLEVIAILNDVRPLRLPLPARQTLV